MVDVRVRDHGRLYLLDPLTDNGRQWLVDNTTRAWKWLSGCLAVEGRYAGPIVDSMISDGLEVEVV
jgi:hypothetical protein